MADKATGDQSFDAWFERYGRQRLAEAAAAHPDHEPLTWERFDGCTAVPDVCLGCCLEHDIAYWYGGEISRAIADRNLRNCIISLGRREREWWSRWFYVCLGWSWWLAVRLFGNRSWKGDPP